jgi:hypothetical protein
MWRVGTLTVGVAFSLAFAKLLADTPQTTKHSDLVTMRGCLHGHEITTNGQRVRLTGNKRLLRELDKHDGHSEEVTGKLMSGDGAGGTHIKEKPINKGRVYVGTGSTPLNEFADSGASSILELRDFSHIENKCDW